MLYDDRAQRYEEDDTDAHLIYAIWLSLFPHP